MIARPWTWARRGVQGAVAGFYLLLPLLGLERVAGTLVSLRLGRLELSEPASALGVLLAARELPSLLVLGLLPVVLLALGAGSVYCGWLCPFGLVSEGLDRLRGRDRVWPARTGAAARRPRAAVLLGMLGLSLLLAVPLSAVLSPPRLVTALPLEAWCGRVVPWVTSVLLLGFLVLELAGPRRVVCRVLCPAGTVAAWLRTRWTWRPRFQEARCCCPAEPECQRVCPWGLDPRTMGTFDGCTSCMTCIEGCPGAALSLRAQSPPSQR